MTLIKNLITSLVDALNSVQRTVWGIFVLTISMWMGLHGKTELCYYFAGVGSTMIGLENTKKSTTDIPSISAEVK